MPHAPFVHLRVRSCYSLLESTVRLERLLERCRHDQAPAVAITDRANLFCALEFSQSAARAGVQPVIGCLLPIASTDQHGNGRPPAPSLLPVLVQSEAGYGNLLRLLSRAHLQGDPGATPELALDDRRAGERGPDRAHRRHRRAGRQGPARRQPRSRRGAGRTARATPSPIASTSS